MADTYHRERVPGDAYLFARNPDHGFPIAPYSNGLTIDDATWVGGAKRVYFDRPYCPEIEYSFKGNNPDIDLFGFELKIT